MLSNSSLVLGMDDAPGADGCMTDSSLNEESIAGLGDSSKADKDGRRVVRLHTTKSVEVYLDKAKGNIVSNTPRI
ncbi:11856_t:CDS:2 [Acaulospora colombiana]|uniref:11856_t:CDS:1 n=1 Tax=Acaulospora colombiana TaxID=27376 RepID=A0ACA9NR52_9GLOM|nr:11856_t:CDS:2 [Acaulospora colombiana]